MKSSNKLAYCVCYLLPNLLINITGIVLGGWVFTLMLMFRIKQSYNHLRSHVARLTNSVFPPKIK